MNKEQNLEDKEKALHIGGVISWCGLITKILKDEEI